MREFFRRFAQRTSGVVGSAGAFLIATLVVICWAVTGPLFDYSDTWQLVINTGTTIVTFLMVFLIQNTQNRDAKAVHLKLDELLRALGPARTDLVDLEDRPDAALARLQDEFARLREYVEHSHGSIPDARPVEEDRRSSAGRRVEDQISKGP
jgi:low affinity Fe/Cu permease